MTGGFVLGFVVGFFAAAFLFMVVEKVRRR
jgi:hypothetical protein